MIALEDLKDGMAVLWRRGHIGDRDTVDWQNEQYQPGILRVLCRDKDIPRSHRSQTQYWRKGDPYAIYIEGHTNWADYGPEDYEFNDYVGAGQLEAEGYLLEFVKNGN